MECRGHCNTPVSPVLLYWSSCWLLAPFHIYRHKRCWQHERARQLRLGQGAQGPNRQAQVREYLLALLTCFQVRGAMDLLFWGKLPIKVC
jgi:hypothetical protein